MFARVDHSTSNPFLSNFLAPSASFRFSLLTGTLLAIGTLHSTVSAAPLPQGGRFVAGKGEIIANCSGIEISQSTLKGIIDWRAFSIGKGQTVEIQNGLGTTLNRVTGRDLSVIEGQLKATGSVYLINPQGIVVGPQGIVSTGGRFVASTLDIRNEDFMNGADLTFTGSSGGSITNLGRIGSSGGDVFLISKERVVNGGQIAAPQGSAELVVGATVLLHDASASRQVFVDAGSHGAVVNRGSIQAAQISLQAADGNIYALAGKRSALRATGTQQRGGAIWLVADGGSVFQRGTAVAVNENGAGGAVDTVGAIVRVSGANVRTSEWDIRSARLNIGTSTAKTFSRSLSEGTSVVVTTTDSARNSHGGNIVIYAPIHWKGDASLTFNAAKSIVVKPRAAIANEGSGDLTLRADAAGLDNQGSVLNAGFIDWSHSLGVVSLFYDMVGVYQPGETRTNAEWSAPAFSGLKTQLTGYELVNSVKDLNKITEKLDGNYALGKDINVGNEPDVQLTPIGEKTLQPFSGQFDGRGHVIDGWFLYLANPKAAYDGLFYEIGSTGVVRNVGITDATIRSDGSVFDGELGVLAGRNLGLITNAYSTGGIDWYAVYPTASNFTVGSGGLVGVNDGTIMRSWSSAGPGTDGLVGGLVGVNSGLILQSYANGYVGAGRGGQPGGLVGENDGTIMQSYSSAQVVGYYGAGLVYSNSGTIEQSYVSGFISAPIEYGAIALDGVGTIKSNVFWDIDTTGVRDPSLGPPPAIGLSAAQMAQAASFGPTWDFSSTGAWALPAGATQPILRWQLTQ